jgi:DNA-binding CsgD family transcriptional regulator
MRPPYARVLQKLRALAGLGLPPELIVPEMSILIGRALATITYPSVFVAGAEVVRSRPQDFEVWLGAEQMVVELRQLLSMGIWPGPRDTPSLQTIMTTRENRRVFAATLWGEGCVDEGPWGDMWRARRLQQGLQAVYFAPSGLTAVAVMAREPGAPAFSAADIAFAESAAPIISAVIDSAPVDEPYDAPVPEVQLMIDGDGKAGPMAFGVAEMLRDMGGGGPGAVADTLRRIERIAADIDHGPAYGVANDPFLHIRHGLTRPAPAVRGIRPLFDVQAGSNAFGQYSIRFSPLSGAAGGAVQQIATIQRRVPLSLIVLRGALAVGASAREIDLLITLVRGHTLEGAASSIGISLSSAKTLLNRILVRTNAAGRAQAIAHLVDLGRSASW